MNEKLEIEQDLTKYLRQDLTKTEQLLTAHKAHLRRLMAILAVIVLSVLTVVGAGVWSIHEIIRANANVIHQAIVMQAVGSAITYSTPKNDTTQIEILFPAGLPLFQEIKH